MNTAKTKYKVLMECGEEIESLTLLGVPREIAENIAMIIFVRGEKSGIRESEKSATELLKSRRLQQIIKGVQ